MILINVAEAIWLSAIVLWVVIWGLKIITKWDVPIIIGMERWMVILAAAIAESALIVCMKSGCVNCVWGAGVPHRVELVGDVVLSFSLAVLGGCLLLACVTDMQFCQVYNFVWWIALGAGALIWLRYWDIHICKRVGGQEIIWSGCAENLGALFFFLLLQGVFFARTYGRADCYAFCVCAVVLAGLGRGLYSFFVHMLLAYGFLFVVQLWRRNVNGKGNLKIAVAFLPYITASFWLTLMWT